MSGRLRRSVAVVLTLVLVAVVVVMIAREPRHPAPPILGMVRQTEVRVGPAIGGRLSAIDVARGDRVVAGAVLATIDSPDAVAAVGEAEAALASARAVRDRVYAGIRAEEVAILADAEHNAESNLAFIEKSHGRVATLTGHGFDSQSRLDESTAALAMAQSDLDLKRAQHSAAAAGPTKEERAVADGGVAVAEAALVRAQAHLAKTRITAPVSGAIGVPVADLGEVLEPGEPILTFVPDGALWFAFTVREDALGDLAIGRKVTLTYDSGETEGIVTEIRPLGEFATWRAARAVGDHDLNSFQLRIDPTGATGDLAPGMTVQLASALAG
jgi:HlyD family secretion protein